MDPVTTAKFLASIKFMRDLRILGKNMFYMVSAIIIQCVVVNKK